ncbi:MAG: DUF2384 domain-containing protein [Taibaiella sp.]|nr:DUF2384 domain-containing protein [Taibaiella sp.]
MSATKKGKVTHTKRAKRTTYSTQEDAIAIAAEAPQPYASTGKAVKILGIPGKNINSITGWINTVRKGIPMQAMRNLMNHASISMDEMANYTHTPRSVLAGYRGNKKLTPELSERTAEIANLYSKGEDVFGDKDRFNLWMAQPSVPLGNKKPKEYLDTSFGIQMLMDELGRIEHGIFA